MLSPADNCFNRFENRCKGRGEGEGVWGTWEGMRGVGRDNARIARRECESRREQRALSRVT
eukprot:412150-Amorphochlora_amoeboformis.AAC.1